MPAKTPESLPLTPKQEAFVREYLVDLNASQAAIRAGYSANLNTAGGIGFENLAKPHIQAALAEAMNARAERTEVTADRVLQELAGIAFGTPEDFDSWGLRYKLNDKLRALELIAKHLGMLTENLNIKADLGGVMVVPGQMDVDAWTQIAKRHQALQFAQAHRGPRRDNGNGGNGGA